MRPSGAGILLSLALLAGLAADDIDAALRGAAEAWDRGDYVEALTRYHQLLNSPAAEHVLEPIALQTGELFHTIELTADGGAPAFSPDARMILHEAGRGALRTTKVIRFSGDGTLIDATTVQGQSGSFSPDATTIVYLRVPRSPRLQELQRLVDAASETDRPRLGVQLAELVGDTARIVVRDVTAGSEREIDTGTLRKTSPIAGAGGTIVFVGWTGDRAPDQLYLVRDGVAPQALTSDPVEKSIVGVNATGTAVLFTPRRRAERDRWFGVVSLPDGRVTIVAGRHPSFSADGRFVAYVTRPDEADRVTIAPTETPANGVVFRAGPPRIDAPALSADGSAVLYQAMPRDDWEIFLNARDGSREVRVTREIQDDVLPRFLTSERFLGAIGESRHRRSYVYDWPSGARRRLFHNNTVRTIAPEYDWVPNRQGTKLLVVAERDGDTVSPERGVYLVDLTRRVTLADLRARVTASLEQEQALRAASARIYAPIADVVRDVVNRASPARIFEYQKALFDFDSKHIGEPGNALAGQYLHKTYESFGYSPELQTFTPANMPHIRTSNVLATLKGIANPELVYVVSSHYDSVAEGPGADDNSSGTAALLEAARILEDHPQPATIVFASFTAEEAGLFGSEEYVRRAQAAGVQIAGAINNDMIGWTNDHRLDATIRYSNAGIRDVQHAAAMQFTRLITYDARYYKNTDAESYHAAFGDIVGGFGAYPILGNPHYHEPHDVLETINHQVVTEVAKATVATIMLLASSPSPVKELKVERVADGAATVSWAPSPEKGITGYVVTWGPADNPDAHQMKVIRPGATLKTAPAGTVVAVKAVNAKGLEGWDAARVTIR